MTMDADSPVGPGRPPLATRFQKGASGNPRGRPKKKVTSAPYEAVLGQMVEIADENGVRRTMSLEQAFMHKFTRSSMSGDDRHRLVVMKAVEKIRALREPRLEDRCQYIEVNNFIFSVNEAMLPLKMAQKMHRRSLSPRILLEPWLVEAARARLADRIFSVEEQREVWGATRTPDKVQWPAWWTERRGTGRRRPKAPLLEAGFHAPCIEPKYE